MNNSFSWDRTLPVEPIQQESSEPFSWENTRAVGQREVTHPLDVEKQMTRDEFLALPFEERAMLSKEMGALGKQEVGEALITGAIPGANRAFEYAREQGYLPEKTAPKLAEGAVKAVGALAPFAGMFKGADKLLGFVALNPALKPYIASALAAGGYETARKALEEGELISPQELAIHTGIGGAAPLAGKLAGKIWEKGKKLFTKESPAIAEGLGQISQTPFETAEETLGLLKGQTPSQRTIPTPVAPNRQARSLQGRVTKQEANRLGLDIPTTQTSIGQKQNLQDRVLNIFPTEVTNSTVAGKNLAQQVQAADSLAYKNVNNLYAKSRAVNEGISFTHPALIRDLEAISQDISRIADPSPIQRKLRQSVNKLVNRLQKVKGKGEDQTIEFLEISNQDLIDQIQSWRQLVDYEFAHGDPHNIYKRAINAVQGAVEEASSLVGGEAHEINQAAKNAYREWTTAFNEGDIRKLRNVQNVNFSENFNRSINIDDLNKLRPILSNTPEGTALLSGMERDLVNKELSSFLKNPGKFSQTEVNRKLRELGAVLSEDQINAIKQAIPETGTPFGRTARRAEKPVPGKYEKTVPEDVLNKMNSRTGIRELRQDLAKNTEQFDKLAKQKVKDILLEGSVEGVPTGDQLYQILNKTKNREILSELLGNDAYGAALAASRQIGKNKATKDQMVRFVKKASVVSKIGAVGLLL